MSPRFLSFEDLLEIHRDQIESYGGSEGLRDPGLLRSAAAMPIAGIANEYFHRDLFDMAAAYLFHIVQNHPFVDGNKRVGAVAAFVLLQLNGFELTAPEEEFETVVRHAARGALAKPEIAALFRANSQRFDPDAVGDAGEGSEVREGGAIARGGS